MADTQISSSDTKVSPDEYAAPSNVTAAIVRHGSFVEVRVEVRETTEAALNHALAVYKALDKAVNDVVVDESDEDAPKKAKTQGQKAAIARYYASKRSR